MRRARPLNPKICGSRVLPVEPLPPAAVLRFLALGVGFLS